MKCDIALIGAGVMGQGLAQNIKNNGYTIGVYDLDAEKVDAFSNRTGIPGFSSMEELVNALHKPRKIILMVNAGAGVDACITQLSPLLEKDDIIIDTGNSYFKDTIRRQNALHEKGLQFAGIGVSGGYEGALKGPSIMVGCHTSTWNTIQDIFTAIAAKMETVPCCGYMGDNGAGHFVKMVHNGIEYGDMQMICEAYHLLRYGLNLSIEEVQQIFKDWNKGKLNSYLIEITADILSKYDKKTGKPMVDVILDTAENKGTGIWSGKTALDLSSSATVITSGVFARFLSGMKDERVNAARVFPKSDYSFSGNKEEAIDQIEQALYFSKICSYAQGFDLLKRAYVEYKWDLDLAEIARIWRGGCIIRAKFLNKISEAYEKNEKLQNMMLDSYFSKSLNRENIVFAIKLAYDAQIPVIAFSNALAYFDAYRCEILPANLLQAQRDYFGAHTYQRNDCDGVFHTNWEEI